MNKGIQIVSALLSLAIIAEVPKCGSGKAGDGGVIETKRAPNENGSKDFPTIPPSPMINRPVTRDDRKHVVIFKSNWKPGARKVVIEWAIDGRGNVEEVDGSVGGGTWSKTVTSGASGSIATLRVISDRNTEYTGCSIWVDGHLIRPAPDSAANPWTYSLGNIHCIASTIIP